MWPEQQLHRVFQSWTFPYLCKFRAMVLSATSYGSVQLFWVFFELRERNCFCIMKNIFINRDFWVKRHPVVERVLTTAFCIFSLRCSSSLLYWAPGFFLWSRWFQPQCQKEIGKNVIQFKNFTAFTLLKRHASLNKLDMYSLFRAFRDVLESRMTLSSDLFSKASRVSLYLRNYDEPNATKNQRREVSFLRNQSAESHKKCR